MQIEDLHSDIVRQPEKKADAEVASKKIAKAKYFGIKINSYGLREAEKRELISNYSASFEQLSLEERLKLARILYSSEFSEQVNFGDAILKLSLNELAPDHYNL